MRTSARSATLPSGINLSYLEQGDPAGLPVLFLHGYSDSWHSFEPVLPHLPTTIRAIALTQRGHGDSGRPADGYTLAQFADDVDEFLAVLEIERAVIVGHSMSSVIAQRFALRHPTRTLALVLLGALASLTDKPVIAELREATKTLTDPVDVEFVREFQESTINQPVPAAFMETVVAESLKMPARVWQAICDGWYLEEEQPDLRHITAPTLVIWGDRDAYCPPADQHRLITEIPEAELKVYEGAGHALHWEEPARFASDAIDFIDALAVAQPGTAARTVLAS